MILNLHRHINISNMINRVYLIGFMGSGKTTIGKYIASDMGWRLIDMDHEFETLHNCSISHFFATKGEEEFRKEETNLLISLSKLDNVIISTGGGVPCSSDNMDVMRSTGLVIYIQVEPEILRQRLSKARDVRPLVSGKKDDELLLFINNKLKEREPFYRRAHMIVDGEALPFSSYKMLITMFPAEVIGDDE